MDNDEQKRGLSWAGDESPDKRYFVSNSTSHLIASENLKSMALSEPVYRTKENELRTKWAVQSLSYRKTNQFTC